MTAENIIAKLEARVVALERLAQRAHDRKAVDLENFFSGCMHLRNHFLDEQIKPLWVKRETPGIHAQYTNVGVYTDHDLVMAYESGRPSPAGKLIFHYPTTPVIKVAEDGGSAKGFWRMAGLESGTTALEQIGAILESLYESMDENVQGNACGRTGSGATMRSTS